MNPRSNLGPKIIATCVGQFNPDASCNWELDTHGTDVRKFGIECMVHLDKNPSHTIVWKVNDYSC